MMKLSRPRLRKERMRQIFEKLLKKYRYVIFIDAYRLRASMLNEVRNMGYDMGYIIKGGKKTVFLKAVERVYPGVVNKLAERLHGQILFLFTNEDPIRISLELDKYEVDLPISPGDIAPDDIVIKAGSTGIPPGPIVGVFSSLGIPTKIIGGTIHVVRDTVVARKGDKISVQLADLLNKLGIKPIKSKVNLKFAYDFKDNIFLEKEHLLPNIEEISDNIKRALEYAVKLSTYISYPTRYNITYLLVKAYYKARAVAIEAEYITPDTITDILVTAYKKALALKNAIEKTKE